MSTDNDSAGLLRILDHPAAIDATARIIAGARRRLWIRSLELESWLFDHPAVLDALPHEDYQSVYNEKMPI